MYNHVQITLAKKLFNKYKIKALHIVQGFTN